MPEPDYFIKVGDGGGRLQATLEDAAGAAVSIQQATVLLKLRPLQSSGTLSLSGSVTNAQNGDGSDGSKGKVYYTFGTADTVNIGAGWFTGEWEATFGSGAIVTYPNDGYFILSVVPDLRSS